MIRATVGDKSLLLNFITIILRVESLAAYPLKTLEFHGGRGGNAFKLLETGGCSRNGASTLKLKYALPFYAKPGFSNNNIYDALDESFDNKIQITALY
ncbi:hypothetical protein TNCV_1981971 [Trichonephila clavipes]|nr:hypothetical protein TNCV_1981971 [Trichonephila clavipes]